MTTIEKTRTLGSLEELYPLLDKIGVLAGWTKPQPSLWAEPKKTYLPLHWRYEAMKAALDHAGDLIPVELADRRNLFLYNPVGGNTYDTTRTLVSAYQMIMPGEAARSHRHTPNALRCIIDAEPGLYTVVDGIQLPMLPGDILLTPGWSWHGHFNEGKANGYWIDVLDVPLVHLLEPMFLEHFPGGLQATEEIVERSPFIFRWADSDARLEAAPRGGPFGRQIELAPSFPTMSLYMNRLDAGEATPPLRTTSSSVVAVVAGSGRSIIDGETFHWKRGDVLAIPAWRPQLHRAETEATLFRATDEATLRTLGFLRRE